MINARCRGSAIARIAGQNVTKHSEDFDSRVPCWVFEEEVSGNSYPYNLRNLV